MRLCRRQRGRTAEHPREGDEIYVGNYGWLCSVPMAEWKTDGAFLVGEAKACGMEGGDDTFDQVLFSA